ncbi:MAG TPA: hypothetical protein VM487_15170, partial [Phycisphaerae bacterium]|nr:hypothetical protein [Phycisphaerae bacterium]
CGSLCSHGGGRARDRPFPPFPTSAIFSRMTTPGYQRFFAELKRRRVFRVMAVYGIVGFVLLQIVDLAVPALLLPEWTYRLVALILLLGFPVAIVLAWAFEMTPGGVRRTVEAGPGELTEIIAAPASKH